MSEVSIHPSVYLAWSIANLEACRSGSERIEPAHFLLATFIIIDGLFEDAAEAMGMSTDGVRAIFGIAAECRLILQMSNDEITTARHRLRQRLRETGTPAEISTLHRSGESRFIFQRVGRLVSKSGTSEMTLAHLLAEILEHLPPEAYPFINLPKPKTIENSEYWPTYITDEKG